MKIFFILFLIIFCNCERKKLKHSNNGVQQVNVYRSNRNLVFPDTIHIDSTYTGFIEYGDDFDKYTTKVNQDNEITRLIDFNYTLDSILYDNDDELEINVNYRSPAFSSDKIELKPIKIGKKGFFYIQGFIKDLVVFDTIEKKSNDKPLDGIEKKYFIRKKIVVVE